MPIQREKVIILGSGPAGYTAAIYAARALLNPLLIAGPQPGGQLTVTYDVENYPGFHETIQGPYLMEQMQMQAQRMGARITDGQVTRADLAAPPFHIILDDDSVHECDSLIICTGARASWLGLPSETAFRGYGVSACATCDGFFFRDKEVFVVGGGNTAIEEALFLSKFATKVTVIHRRDSFRAEKVMQQKLFRNEKISVRWNTVLHEILGETDPPCVTGVVLSDVKTGEKKHVPADGVFISIGHVPETGLFKGQLDMSDTGYILTAPNSTHTSRPGVFAAGDVTDDIFRQAVTAAGMGCMAALECEKYLSELDARDPLDRTEARAIPSCT